MANHNGHELRSEVAALSVLDEASRLREEDPFTGEWAEVVASSLVAQRSRLRWTSTVPGNSGLHDTG